MTEVTFVDSIQEHQTRRIRAVAERLRARRPDVTVTLLEGEAAKATLAEHRLSFGPAVLIDGRLEYVGVPRWRHLQERLAQVSRGVPNPRTAAPPPKPAAAAPAKPAAPEKKSPKT